MTEPVLTLISTVTGAAIGFMGAVYGAIIAENRRRKKELSEFYSWVYSLLEILLKMEEIEEVKVNLTAPGLHYSFHKLWSQIPEKEEGLKIREPMYQFLKGGGKLDEVMENNNLEGLRDWLEKRAK